MNFQSFNLELGQLEVRFWKEDRSIECNCAELTAQLGQKTKNLYRFLSGQLDSQFFIPLYL